MKRIEFLRLAAMASAAGLLGFTEFNPKDKGKKVIIVGAGMSGIAAAKMLRENGYEVVLIEGQNRLGGRIRTEEFEGAILDMGASWIQGSKGNPITGLVTNYGIETKDTDYDRMTIWKNNGDQLSDEARAELFKDTDWVFQQAYKVANRSWEDISMEDCINKVLEGEKMTDEEAAAMNWRTTTQEMDAGCDFSKISTWYTSDAGFGGIDKMFPGGYKQLIDKMAEGLDVKFEKIVTEITYDSKQVKVATATESWEADYCICTVPLGVLRAKRIKFHPPLPKHKTYAIENKLSMGVLNKIAFKFPKIFWSKEDHMLGHISENRGDFPVFLNYGALTGAPILLGFLVGDYARAFEKLSDQEVIDRGNKLFAKLYKNAEPIEAVHRSKWNEHPFAYGSYSYVPVGSGKNGSDILAEPIKRLHFAGEASNRKYPATVHGAYLTGIREAERILYK